MTFDGRTIADYVAMPLAELADTLRPTADRTEPPPHARRRTPVSWRWWRRMIAADLVARLADASISGSAISRSIAALRRCRPASCSGCGWPRRCAPNLFGVVYVLDEPSAGCIRPTPRRCWTRSSG